MKGDRLIDPRPASDALLREAAQLVVDDAWYREGEEVSTLPTRNLIRLRAALAATPPASAERDAVWPSPDDEEAVGQLADARIAVSGEINPTPTDLRWWLDDSRAILTALTAPSR